MRLSHKSKVRKKKHGFIVKRYEIREVGAPLFSRNSGAGKNSVYSYVIGITSKGKTYSLHDKLSSYETSNRG